MSHRDPGSGINIFVDDDPPLTGARVKVIGVGSGGGNAVNRMIGAGIEGIEFIVANTDLQALKRSRAPIKIQLGSKLTKGLGVGADPALGREAALEDTEVIIEVLEGADLVFIVCPLGGGTGTGAGPVITSLAAQMDITTIVVATTPFLFEGRRRLQQAKDGISELLKCAETTIVIPNEQLIRQTDPGIKLSDAFRVADDVLRQAVQAISDLLTVPGLINLDFADIKSIVTHQGIGIIGAGRAIGENRAIEATVQALTSPLLQGMEIKDAKSILINITGAPDLTLFEVNAATSLIRESANDDAALIFGAVIDETLTDEFRITLVANGFERLSVEIPERIKGTTAPELFPNIIVPWSSEEPEDQKNIRTALPAQIPDIVVAWNPEVVNSEEYALLVTSLGDLVRIEGGLGVERISSKVSISSPTFTPGGEGSGADLPEGKGRLA